MMVMMMMMKMKMGKRAMMEMIVGRRSLEGTLRVNCRVKQEDSFFGRLTTKNLYLTYSLIINPKLLYMYIFDNIYIYILILILILMLNLAFYLTYFLTINLACVRSVRAQAELELAIGSGSVCAQIELSE